MTKTEHPDDCPNCGNDPLEDSHNVDVELSDGASIKAYLCGECGIIYVPDAHDTVRVARAKSVGDQYD